MKKTIATLLLITTLLLSFTSCNVVSGIFGNQDSAEQTKLRIGYMSGPTGMGMAKLVSDNGGLENGNEKYSFVKYENTKTAKADLAAGKIDIICLPTNEAADYHRDIDSTVKVLAINCLNSLYLIGPASETVTSLSDFEGKTLYTCKNGTPRIILEYILNEAGINATVSYEIDGKVMLTPADLSAQVAAYNLPNAVLPEPLVTSSLMEIKKSDNPNWSVKVDLSDEWKKISDTPITMGCILASGQVVTNHKTSVDAFLEEYKSSVDFIGNPDNLDSASNYVVETGVMKAAPAAQTALKNLGNAISYIDGSEMKNALIAFYNAIGISLPSDTFYYEKQAH